MMRWSSWNAWMRYAGPMLAPILLGAAVFYFMREPLAYTQLPIVHGSSDAMACTVSRPRPSERSPVPIAQFCDSHAEKSANLRC